MMIFIVLSVLLAACTAAPVEESRGEYRCGGGAGDYHSYYNDYEAYGQIRRVEVWAGDVVDGIRFTHGDASSGTIYGSETQKHGDFILNDGEYITGADIRQGNWWGYLVVCQIRFITTKGSYGPYGYCPQHAQCGERTWNSQTFYVNLRAGRNLDWISFQY